MVAALYTGDPFVDIGNRGCNFQFVGQNRFSRLDFGDLGTSECLYGSSVACFLELGEIV